MPFPEDIPVLTVKHKQRGCESFGMSLNDPQTNQQSNQGAMLEITLYSAKVGGKNPL
jgi:hypothetical protein